MKPNQTKSLFKVFLTKIFLKVDLKIAERLKIFVV